MAPISSGSAREGLAHAALTEMIFIITGACLITTSSRREYALSYLDCGCRPPDRPSSASQMLKPRGLPVRVRPLAYAI
jgi:hypothetical protein